MIFNWGHSITTVIILFMGFVLFLVIRMHGKSVELVDPAYYSKEISYQSEINQQERGKLYRPEIVSRHDSLVIQFTEDIRLISLELRRPSDSKQDVSLLKGPLRVKTLELPMGAIQRGPWNLELLWVQHSDTCLIKYQFIRR